MNERYIWKELENDLLNNSFNEEKYDLNKIATYACYSNNLQLLNRIKHKVNNAENQYIACVNGNNLELIKELFLNIIPHTACFHITCSNRNATMLEYLETKKENPDKFLCLMCCIIHDSKDELSIDVLKFSKYLINKYNLYQQLLDYEQKQIQERSQWSFKLENKEFSCSLELQLKFSETPRNTWQSKYLFSLILNNELKASSEDIQYWKKMEKEKSQITGWIGQIKYFMS